MVVVVIVLVIILQNEPITTDTITILTRHFIILTQKQKYAVPFTLKTAPQISRFEWRIMKREIQFKWNKLHIITAFLFNHFAATNVTGFSETLSLGKKSLSLAKKSLILEKKFLSLAEKFFSLGKSYWF